MLIKNKELLESEEQYRPPFEKNPHPMWVFDWDAEAIVAVNEAATKQCGYSRKELLGITLDRIFSAEELPRFLEAQKTHSQPKRWTNQGRRMEVPPEGWNRYRCRHHHEPDSIQSEKRLFGLSP